MQDSPHIVDPELEHPVTIDAVCRGAAWDLGVAQGNALRHKIRDALQVFSQLEAVQLAKSRWVPLPVFRRLAEIKAKKLLNKGLAQTLPSAAARLQGIAKGAGVSPRSICLLNAMEPVMSDLTKVAVLPVEAACSAVAVTGPASANGQPIVAHNFDYLPSVRPLYTIRECRPEGKLRSLEFTAAPMCGAVDGINEAGLCITYNYAHTIDGKRPAPTLSMWISETLATCSNVAEAAELLSGAKRWGGGILMLGDAEGNIASLELSSTDAQLRWPNDKDHRIFHSNRFHTDKMRLAEVDDQAVYSCNAPRALRDRRIHQSAEHRDGQFETQFMQQDRYDAAGIHQVMSHHGPTNKPSADSICMHSDYWHTTACLQFFPHERKVRVAYNNACKAKFVELAL